MKRNDEADLVRVVLDLNVLIRGSLGFARYVHDKYVMGNTLSFSEDTTPETRVFSRTGSTFRQVVSDQLIEEWERVRVRDHWKGQLEKGAGNGNREVS
jgi:hypothetical protein